MEKRQKFLLSELSNALYKKDEVPGSENKKVESKPVEPTALSASATELTSLASPSTSPSFFSGKDFTIHYQSIGGRPSDIDYTETRFDGPGSVLGKPIHGSDDPERAIMTVGLAPVGSAMRMSVLLEKEDGTVFDKVTVSRIKGNYDELRANLTMTESPVGEVTGHYFTMKIAENKFDTYQHINQDQEVVLLQNTNAETHNMITLSFLALTTI